MMMKENTSFLSGYHELLQKYKDRLAQMTSRALHAEKKAEMLEKELTETKYELSRELVRATFR
jgi:hypothetical protein